MSWTDERIEKLRELWPQGLSFSQIAAELGGGITRAAVQGKARRLGLEPRPKREAVADSGRTQRRRRAAAKRFLSRPPLAFSTPIYVVEPDPLPDRKPTHATCQHISGDVPRWPSLPDYCGKRATHGAYCEGHYRVTHIIRTPKSEAA